MMTAEDRDSIYQTPRPRQRGGAGAAARTSKVHLFQTFGVNLIYCLARGQVKDRSLAVATQSSRSQAAISTGIASMCNRNMHAWQLASGSSEFCQSKKKPPDRSPAARIGDWSRRSGGRSAAGLAEIHFEVAQVDLRVALTLLDRLVVDFRPPLRFRLQRPCLAGSLVLSLAVDALFVYGSALSRGSAILPPQNSQRP